MAARKYVVTLFDNHEYEIEADRVEVDVNNKNVVTLYRGDAVVAHENNCSGVRPKNP